VYYNHGLVQGVDIQADGSDTMQVGEGSARQFNTTVWEVSACYYVSPSLVSTDVFPFEMRDCYLHKILIALFLISLFVLLFVLAHVVWRSIGYKYVLSRMLSFACQRIYSMSSIQ